MNQIKIKNWSSLQSYKDRKPPWIRLHKSLLDNFEYQMMSAEARAILPMLWLLASEDDDPQSGIIKYNTQQIAFRLRLSEEIVTESIREIEKAGFFEDYQVCNETVTKPLLNCNETVTPETETETETYTEKSISPESLTASSLKRIGIFIEIPTNRKDEFYPVTKSQITEWCELFPAVDVEQELRQMVAWSKANPGKRKTSRGMEKFIVNWLGREQDKGKPSAPKQPEPSITEVTPFRTVKTQEEYKQFLTDQEAGRLKTQEIIQQVKDKYRRQAS